MNEYKNRKMTQSFIDAFRGLWFCIKSERNMRIHAIVAVYLLFFANFLDVSRSEYALLFAVVGVMITAEALNTSIEKLCNFACNHRDRRIGTVKDIAAGAVLVSALTSVCIGFIILFKPTELIALAGLIFTNWIFACLFLISAIMSIVFIIVGPLGIKKWFRKTKKKI